ncbi:aminopeptidase [Caproiciproducens galactitolivorans]|uniref:M18 family aminopeptidase n=2 Tax=Caproiciproducens galactitolivorans TaxID=642589 RepID=A0ABT4BTG9_9FIRM|nr:aminopeptidase [Caproiciproducens galactitolivorans]MCY1714185.1 aminopeptidase [Caproiciproducens galactitolivorans]
MMTKLGKEEVKKMSDELLLDRKNGYFKVEDEKVQKADEFCKGYKKFLDASKTEREAVCSAVKTAEAAGFVPFDAEKKYRAGDKVYYNNRGKALILAVIGKNGCKNGVRIAAAHIDSPRLDLKPHPLYEKDEIALFKTHYYGGIKKYQWTAIPLSMHGIAVRKDGTPVEICIGEEDDDPQFCVTDLLPHLSSEQYEKTLSKAFEGENLNIVVGSRPVRADEGDNLFKLNVMKLIHEKYGMTEEDFVSADIEFVPAFKARDIGIDRSMIGSYGHDDRVCAYPAIMAVLDSKVPESTVLTVLADKEEIGSEGNTGLNSQFMHYFIADLARAEGLEPQHVLSKSKCLSADVTAAYDPTYPSAYEPNNSCYINNGVGMAKYTGSRGKSGSSEARAEFVSEIRRLFEANDVLWQIGELGKVDGGGGGTVALYIANLNVDVLDVGVPVLSMHAPFEIVSKLDVYMTYLGIRAFYEAE